MLSILISMNLMFTFMFIMMNHPLSMGLVLLIQTILVSLITGNLNQNMWFSYILFLIMVGGMLILFMYMTSIASNEKFKINNKMAFMLMLIILMSIFSIKSQKMMIMNNETMEFAKSINLMTSLNKFINVPLSSVTIFLMIYLLLALIATVKITNFKQGSIRQMN
uniref:NADH-ubiquinone oxidoreductase chain 6 n=1 Tax=Platydema sp. PLA01 TaxID=1205640 RepID=A0A0S2MS22_9CUCU|nr:NADH deshydrogenase subunit 6 [Platydema sp. PLA01]